MPPSDSPALPLAAPVRDDAPAPPVLIALLAVAAGLGAANLYYAQPLAATIARSLGAPPSQVAAPLLLTQLGYALGMVLLVSSARTAGRAPSDPATGRPGPAAPLRPGVAG